MKNLRHNLLLEIAPSPIQNIDSGTETLVLTPSSTDVGAVTDVNTEALSLTPNYPADAGPIVDSNTEYINLDAFATQEGPAGYTDTSIERLSFTPSGSDIFIHTYVDAATEPLKLIPSGLELETAYLDTAIEPLVLVPSGADVLERMDAATERVALLPSSEDRACVQKVEFEGDLNSRWNSYGQNRWSAATTNRWQGVFLGVGEGFAC